MCFLFEEAPVEPALTASEEPRGKVGPSLRLMGVDGSGLSLG